MQDQLSQEPTQPATDALLALRTQIEADLALHGPDGPRETFTDVVPRLAEAVMDLLQEQGVVVPGVPPLNRVLADFKVTHDRLTLTMLALRILNMLAFTEVQTPESKPARRFIDDYLEGKNHGPAGEPMLWPGRLPGLAGMLRQWGYVPTIALPGQPSFVAKAQPQVRVQ